MAEVHIIGRIVSASGFVDHRLFCCWKLEIGGGWRTVEGETEGQTQTDLPEFEDVAYFSHPLDIHLATKTIQGWPKISLQVWHHDQYGRQEIYGYGSVFVPTTPGTNQVTCHIWRPKGSFREEMMQYFLGGGIQLTEVNYVENVTRLSKLRTTSMGTVQLELSIITRNFEKFGILS
uniref:B9 domain-containing protein 2 n=1 Tax=Syphacia muris TaxID=451379 RepID=A0A0N5AHA5_9BILA